MGIFSKLGAVVGGAIGSIVPGVGTAIGSSVGGALGGGVDSLTKKKSSSGTSAPAAPSIPSYTSGKVELKGDIKVARTYQGGVAAKEQEDPWQSTKDWYTDLGGDGDKLNFETVSF